MRDDSRYLLDPYEHTTELLVVKRSYSFPSKLIYTALSILLVLRFHISEKKALVG